jgi:hypothetical protein
MLSSASWQVKHQPHMWYLNTANVGISPKSSKPFACRIRVTLNGVGDGTAGAASWPESVRATGFAKLLDGASQDCAQPPLRYHFPSALVLALVVFDRGLAALDG